MTCRILLIAPPQTAGQHCSYLSHYDSFLELSVSDSPSFRVFPLRAVFSRELESPLLFRSLTFGSLSLCFSDFPTRRFSLPQSEGISSSKYLSLMAPDGAFPRRLERPFRRYQQPSQRLERRGMHRKRHDRRARYRVRGRR